MILCSKNKKKNCFVWDANAMWIFRPSLAIWAVNSAQKFLVNKNFWLDGHRICCCGFAVAIECSFLQHSKESKILLLKIKRNLFTMFCSYKSSIWLPTMHDLSLFVVFKMRRLRIPSDFNIVFQNFNPLLLLYAK